MQRMEHALPPLIRALLEPQRYPGAGQRVDLVQTHISWVLLSGDLAYKIKKPVRLPFLDFSTLEQRRLCCLEELRLNRRFAPDIYLDVVPLFDTAQGPAFSGSGSPIEYAVKMRRFDEAGRLDRLCKRGALRSAHLSDLADALVAFHAAAAPAPADSGFGSASEIRDQALENFQELLRLLPGAGMHGRLAALRGWTETQCRLLGPLMAARQREGQVRECHGDLHLANLVLIDGRVRMFDCIEFSPALRWIDVASELAFTYVDLLEHGRSGLANWLVNEVWSRNGDYQAARLLRFYAVYRALVRAKVAAIRSDQTSQADGAAAAYVALAEGLVAPPALRLVITHGLSGCGKTRASSQLLHDGHQAGCVRLRADVERKRLYGLSGSARSGSGLDAGIYAAAAHDRTYAHLRETAAMLLDAGWSVLVDASFLRSADRSEFRALARRSGAAFAILAPHATQRQLRERVRLRAERGRDASEATLEVLARQRQMLEPLQPDELPFVINQPEGVTPCASDALKKSRTTNTASG